MLQKQGFNIIRNFFFKFMIWKRIGFRSGQTLLKMGFSNAQTNKSAQFLTEEPQSHHDIIFIRHAESLFNQACEQYRKANEIPYIWKNLLEHQGFNEAVLFNPEYMDCPLTQHGKSQCMKAKNKLEGMKVDCVVVSPQLRALQTCQNIFEAFGHVPVFVEPLLVGPLRSCCDVNRPTNIKKAMFPYFDFKETQNYQELWYLDYLHDEQKQACEVHFQENNVKNTDEQRVEIVRLMKKQKVYEDPIIFRKRVQNIKYLLDKYRQRYEKIAVITHYYTIQYLTAIKYREDGSPKFYIDIKNCRPYFASLRDLLSVRESGF